LARSLFYHALQRNAVRDISANKEIAQNVVSIENNEVNAANEGKLVHINGTAKTNDILRNTEFGVEQNAIRLKWNASICQWIEKSHTKSKKNIELHAWDGQWYTRAYFDSGEAIG
jgi:hypothetical protein